MKKSEVRKRMGLTESTMNIKKSRTSICLEDIPEDNGLVLNNILFPEELLLQILTYVPIKTLPKCPLVCKKWNEIIKSSYFWRTLCLRSKNKKKITNKTLPVYAYYALELNEFFDVNLIKNNCGQEEFKHWKIKSNGGDRFRIENPPCGANVLPESPDFNDHQSCFATSFQNCSKYQVIDFNGNKLYEKIFDELRPKIYVSEWYAGRFDCGSKYKLSIWLLDKDRSLLDERFEERVVNQWEGSEWLKVEFTMDCPKGLREIHFYHSGVDTQFWAGHYGSKMSGAVLKILWDSLSEDKEKKACNKNKND